jgi:hypothetical protein
MSWPPQRDATFSGDVTATADDHRWVHEIVD